MQRIKRATERCAIVCMSGVCLFTSLFAFAVWASLRTTSSTKCWVTLCCGPCRSAVVSLFKCSLGRWKYATPEASRKFFATGAARSSEERDDDCGVACGLVVAVSKQFFSYVISVVSLDGIFEGRKYPFFFPFR